jgi:hypothetical protein
MTTPTVPAPPVCSCRIAAPGTKYEQRTLDRDCPIHGDRDPAARRLRVIPEQDQGTGP